MVELGEQSYYAVAGVLLTLVLLVAPAATAGAVCLDRERGWLAHMFVTELTDAEIVLGKLVARLASVVALVIAVVPLLAISLLMGGIIPEALVYLTLTTLAVALLGCSLALALSVRAAKTHEVLMLVFALWAIWLLSCPIWLGAASSGFVARRAGLVRQAQPVRPGLRAVCKAGLHRRIRCRRVCDRGSVHVNRAVLFAIRSLRKDLRPLGASIREGREGPSMDQVAALLLVANPDARWQPRALARVAPQPAVAHGSAGFKAVHRLHGAGHGRRHHRLHSAWNRHGR